MRADANNLWQGADACIADLKSLGYDPWPWKSRSAREIGRV